MPGFTIYELKPKFQSFLRPVVRALYSIGVKANAVTLSAAISSLAVGALMWWVLSTPGPSYGQWVESNAFERERSWSHIIFMMLPVFLFLRMALNAIDGMLAREFRQKSMLGAFLNELGDVISDVALYFPFIFVLASGGWILALAIFISVLGEFAGVISQALGASRRYDGPLGKSDRAVMFGLLSIALACGYVPRTGGVVFAWAILILAVFTLIKRTRRSILELGTRIARV